jgi:hypothetical protein
MIDPIAASLIPANQRELIDCSDCELDYLPPIIVRSNSIFPLFPNLDLAAIGNPPAPTPSLTKPCS